MLCNSQCKNRVDDLIMIFRRQVHSTNHNKTGTDSLFF